MRLLLLLIPAVVFGQNASLGGRVSDESGAVIPGASIGISASGVAKKTSSAADGSWSFSSLAPGVYTVSALAPQLALPKPVTVSVHAGANTLNLQLKVTAAAEQLTVTENAGPLVGTDSSANVSATVIAGRDLDALSDDPEDLQADLEALAGPAAGPSGGAIFVDGFSGGQLPPKESIREIRINSNPFSPNTTSSATVELRSSPSRARTSSTALWATTSAPISGTPAIPTPE